MLFGFLFVLFIILVEVLQGVAQFGSVPVLGTGGRRFKSCHLEFLNKKIIFNLTNFVLKKVICLDKIFI